MKTLWEFIPRAYQALLSLYPQTYRDEFGEELRAVFQLSLNEARRAGHWRALELVSREFLSLPAAVVDAHLRGLREVHMLKKYGRYLDFNPGSRREALVALFPFVVTVLVLPLINMLGRSQIVALPNPLATAIMLILLALIGLLLVSGFALGLPRWSLPYVGFGAALLSVYVFSFLIGGLLYVLFSGFIDRVSFFGDIFLDGVFWFGLLIAMAVLVLGSLVSPKFQRFRSDWTLLGFMLYGAVPFVIWLSFDEYVGEEPYELLAFLVLAVGAWSYLRSTDPQQRFWSLFGALMVCIFITAACKAILIPSQDWPFALDRGLVISEVKHTLIMWGWLALIMLMPLLLKGLSDTEASTKAEA